MSRERHFDLPYSDEDPQPPSVEQLVQRVIANILQKFATLGLKATDLKRLGPDVGMGQVLRDKNFTLSLLDFLKRNAYVDKSMHQVVCRAMSEEYPFSRTLRKKVKKLKPLFSREEEERIRKASIEAWVDETYRNDQFQLLKEQASDAIEAFIEFVFDELANVDIDKGYESVADTGISRPSEVRKRTAFADISKALPIGLMLKDEQYLAFFVPKIEGDGYDRYTQEVFSDEEERYACEEGEVMYLDDDPVDDQDLDTSKDTINEAENEEEFFTDVPDPENYFVILDHAVATHIMEALCTEERFLPIFRCLVAFYIAREQQGYLDVLEEFFSGVAFFKNAEISDEFDSFNEELMQKFWQQLEELIAQEGKVVIHWLQKPLPQGISTAENPDDMRLYTLTFECIYSETLDVLVEATDPIGMQIDTIYIYKRVEDQKSAWFFQDGETIVGDEPNAHIEEGKLSIAQSIVNDFFQQFVLKMPESLQNVEYQLQRLQQFRSLFEESESFAQMLTTFNTLQIKNKDGSINIFTLKTHSQSRLKYFSRPKRAGNVAGLN